MTARSERARWGLMAMAAVWLAFLPDQARALTLTEGTAWSDTEIPVCWQDMRRQHRQERALIRKAVSSTWERESALRFTGWRKCRPGMDGIWITLENGHPRTRGRGSALDGKAAGVVLPVLWSLAALSINIKAPVHEFGHVLGFGHEYARRDMPADLAGECSGTDRSGDRYYEDDTALTPFDPDSIMVGCRSRATLELSTGVANLSPTDILGVVRLYGSHPDNVLDADETGDRFGAELRVADLDRDGVPDLAVAAPGEDDGEGAVYLYRGDSGRGLRPWRIATPDDLDQLARLDAHAVSIPVSDDTRLSEARPIGFPQMTGPAGRDAMVVRADLDGDGHVETIVGLPHTDGGAPQSGAVVILRGLSGGWSRPWYWFGQRH